MVTDPGTETGTESTQFPEKEYINGIFVAVHVKIFFFYKAKQQKKMWGETLALGRLSKGEAKVGVKEEEEEEEEVPKLLEFTVKENQEGVYRQYSAKLGDFVVL